MKMLSSLPISNTASSMASSGSRKRKAGEQGGERNNPNDKAWLERNDRDARWHCKRPRCDSKPDRESSYDRHTLEGSKTTRYWCQDCPKTFCTVRALTSHRAHSRRCAGTGFDDAHLISILADGFRLSPLREDLPSVNILGRYYVDEDNDQSTAAGTHAATSAVAQPANGPQASSNIASSFSTFGFPSVVPTDNYPYTSYIANPNTNQARCATLHVYQNLVDVGEQYNYRLPDPISRISNRPMPRDPVCPRCGDRSSFTETECES